MDKRYRSWMDIQYVLQHLAILAQICAVSAGLLLFRLVHMCILHSSLIHSFVQMHSVNTFASLLGISRHTSAQHKTLYSSEACNFNPWALTGANTVTANPAECLTLIPPSPFHFLYHNPRLYASCATSISVPLPSALVAFWSRQLIA